MLESFKEENDADYIKIYLPMFLRPREYIDINIFMDARA